MILYSGELTPIAQKFVCKSMPWVLLRTSVSNCQWSNFLGKLKETSPIGRIPILKTSEAIIPESEVIAEYIDELYPQRALGGKTPLERVNVRVLSRIADTYLMDNIFQRFLS